ncbi:MAG: response regulator [Deltaproteobacteria bacterium]|nr:MAG: response regulator [Deltaproteobacteria bacterium]
MNLSRISGESSRGSPNFSTGKGAEETALEESAAVGYAGQDKIILFFAGRENERLAKEFLSPRYQVATGTVEAVRKGNFDLALSDLPSLKNLRDHFLTLREERHPIVFPLLLVTTREDVSLVTEELFRVVDDLLLVPAGKLEFLARVEVLLRMRRMSREMERRYFTLAERSPVGILLVEGEKILYANPTLAWKLGKVPPLLSGERVSSLVHPEDRDAFFRYLISSPISGGIDSPPGEVRFVGPAGEIWMELYCSDVSLKGRRARLVFGVDVTRRKKAEEEKERVLQQLIQAQKMEALGLLAGGVAHDFNNYLTTIRSYGEILLMKFGEDSEAGQCGKKIVDASDRAAELTRKLLLFGKRKPMRGRVLSLNDLVKEMEDLLARMLGESISLTLSLAAEDPLIEGDEASIEQAVMNMVLNARDAVENGGEVTIRTALLSSLPPRVASMKEIPPPVALLSVSDTGHGIPESLLERIFEPFFTTKGPGRGTGLGLSVVYGIVTQHGGIVDVKSRVGKGTTFTLYFPAVSRPKEKERQDEGELTWSPKGEMILLIEDEDAVREGTARLLEHAGFTVREAASAGEAREIFSRERGNISLVLSDVVLPDGSGVDLVKEFKREEPALPVVLASGYVDRVSRLEEIEKSGIPLLTKPYTFRSLLTIFGELLKKGAER